MFKLEEIFDLSKPISNDDLLEQILYLEKQVTMSEISRAIANKLSDELVRQVKEHNKPYNQLNSIGLVLKSNNKKISILQNKPVAKVPSSMRYLKNLSEDEKSNEIKNIMAKNTDLKLEQEKVEAIVNFNILKYRKS
jgi:hypothetical protein